MIGAFLLGGVATVVLTPSIPIAARIGVSVGVGCIAGKLGRIGAVHFTGKTSYKK